MAELAVYRGANPHTIIAGATPLARGVRVIKASDGTFSVANAATRGDYSTREPIEANGIGGAFEMNVGTVPALASEAATVGALAYGAANGKYSVTATSAALVGRWEVAASGDGVLGAVKLLPSA